MSSRIVWICASLMAVFAVAGLVGPVVAAVPVVHQGPGAQGWTASDLLDAIPASLPLSVDADTSGDHMTWVLETDTTGKPLGGEWLHARLRGSPGTDLELKLHGPSSTSPDDTHAIVATSSIPGTSTEEISVWLGEAGPYYLEVGNPRYDEGAFHLEATTETSKAATSITIGASPPRVYLPKPFVLSGVMTPASIGDRCLVYVRKPGLARWSYSSTRLACALTPEHGARWWYRYTPRMRGTYYFCVYFLGDASRLPSRSWLVAESVR